MAHETELTDAYYNKVLKRIPYKDWFQFARQGLRLEESDIDDIFHDHPNNVKERKFQMCKRWERNVGGQASAQRILKIMEKFLTDEPCEVASETHHNKERTDENNAIVIICDETIKEKAEDSKRILKDEGHVVYLNVGTSLLSHQLMRAMYKIYLVSGSMNVDEPTAMLTESSPSNVLVIVRQTRRNAIPACLERFTIHCIKKKLTSKLIAEFISQFVQGKRKNEDSGHITAHETSEDELCQSPSRIDSARFTEFAGQLEKLNILKKPFDRKYCYVLITSTFQNSNADLKSLVEIPWMQVFDFDPKSEVKGFLSKVELVLKSRRHYTVDESQSAVLDENVTNWIFINGHCNIANADIPTEHKINSKLTRLHCESLTAYCQGRKVPFVLVLWYPRNSNCDKNLKKFISILEFYMETSVNSFKCIFCVSTKPNDKAPLGKMINQLKFKNVIVVPLEVICAWLSENNRSSEVQDSVSVKRTIPKFSEKVKSKESFEIENMKYNWLNVCFSVLLVNEVTTEGKQSLTEKGEDYLKGGKLSWDVIASGSYDAERDLLEEKKRVIQQQFIETGKSGIISIYHQPGSGGTTFARRLLWELRKDAPCLELKATEFTIDEVKERLTFIRNETHLSPILLIDGNSTYDARTLLEFCRYERLVILHVQRVYSLSPGERNKKTDEIWLPERLSLSEAKLLTGIFSQAKPESKKRLMSLTDDIESGKDHVMFEYGLTAYESDFRGVRRYVHGNLRIKAQSKEFEGWQLALAYLSLANYYGQCALPCKLFGSLLGKKGEDIVRIEDLPHSGQKFITEDECGEWNISYYAVAKEILEQVLAKRDSTDYYKSEGNYLSDEACRELSKLALMFIDFIKDNLSDTNYIPSYFKDILTWIFIIRNYKNTPEKDKSGSKHSRLVENTKKPEDKQRILEKLVKCFPNDADFHAHLGRFFSRTKKPNEASECFENAIAVRLRNVTEKSKKRGDAGLCRFHHMYGHHLSQLMRTEIQEYQVPGNTARHSSVTVILDYADQAVTQFSNSVKFYQIGCSASYIYLGEIDVRICIAELDHKIKQLHLPSALKKRLNDFVLKSFSRCDHLISECIYYSANDDIPQNEIDKYINKFIAFFHNTEQALKKWAGNDEGIHSKRCHISIMKMNKGYKRNNKQSFVYDFMTNGQEVEEFISLCEGIFEDAEREVHREYHISHNMLEWLQAIRHPTLTKRYTLIDVERSVSKWDNRKERGSLSTYYHYVLTTLVAICGPNSQTCNTYSEKSGKLRDELTREAMIPRFLMDRSFEWLAICEDAQFFNNSIYYSRLGEFDGKFWKSTEKIACLRACKGTIRRCEIHRGLIVLDGAHKPSICVFFNPQRYGFYTYEGKQSQRVEFYLGFNPKHGAEAYQVRKLDKTECRDCKTSVETPKLGATSRLIAKCPSCNNTIRYSA